jgi:poly(A) polymerase
MTAPRIDFKEVRSAALRIAGSLIEAGHETYFAGGCVRDRLFGLSPTDIDIATAATPDLVREVFPRAKGVGASFGVMLVPSDGCSIEVATFRSDFAYEDGRRPGRVRYGTAEEDAQRRDFTINGLFEVPSDGRIVDLVGGRADIDARVLRAIGDPEARFEEDRLRMLRGVRFAARFDLAIEPATEAAISVRADRLGGVSRERVGQELRRMLADRGRVRAAAMVESTTLDRTVLGVPRSSEASGRFRLEAMPGSAPWIDALAAWELDRGTAGDAVERLTPGLVLSNEETATLRALLETRRRLQEAWETLGVAARKRLAATPLFARSCDLLATEAPDLVAEIQRDTAVLRATGLAPTPLLTGEDLKEIGMEAGPAFGRILTEVYDAQLEGRVRGREDAILLARELGEPPASPGADA